ncbi:MAG: hypothetical protein ACRCS8_03240 [Brevinema sp.]
MKRLALLVVLATAATSAHAANNYAPGNLILGIGLGAGSASVLPVGGAQMTVNPSVEIIFGAWNPSSTGVALGMTLDSSGNFFGGTTGTLATMMTMHVTFVSGVDWYTSLGMGLQLLPVHGTSGAYNLHVGFQTGFNFMITKEFFIYTGMAIHAEQIFGAAGFKFRFGKVSR